MIRNDIESLRIEGFRSIEDILMDGLPPVAVLISANGSGKSNILRFVEMLGWMTRPSGGRLAEFAERHGGAGDQLFRGAAVTERIAGEIGLRRGGVRHGYRFGLAYAADERLFFSSEDVLRVARADGGFGLTDTERALHVLALSREGDELDWAEHVGSVAGEDCAVLLDLRPKERFQGE